jgi:hypothetical protein
MKGILFLAFNTPEIDYYQMASYTAARASRFLNLPCSIITSPESRTTDYEFDQVIYTTQDNTNYRSKSIWSNKGRYQVFELSPYEETLVLDVDYMINSNRLLETFKYTSDFVCYHDPEYLLESLDPEKLSRKSVQTLWATVMRFRKTSRTEQIFNMMNMIQDNYRHYGELYSFLPDMYRNDYALTIALKTVNGHLENPEDYIMGKLNHVGVATYVQRIDDVTYKILGRPKNNIQNYIIIKDHDFHMLNKKNFKELMT